MTIGKTSDRIKCMIERVDADIKENISFIHMGASRLKEISGNISNENLAALYGNARALLDTAMNLIEDLSMRIAFAQEMEAVKENDK